MPLGRLRRGHGSKRQTRAASPAPVDAGFRNAEDSRDPLDPRGPALGDLRAGTYAGNRTHARSYAPAKAAQWTKGLTED